MTAPADARVAGQPARAGGPDDAIDGIEPALVVRPADAAGVAAVLGEAGRVGRSVVIRGGGTKRALGRRPRPVDLIVDLSGLNRVITHRHGDLTATVEAGATVTSVNATLGKQGQWLACDSAHEGATIGGLVATNESGPHRHRFGTPRDQLIGVTLATIDGRLVRAGGQVVKNVAGYDLGKLVSGSCGTLAAIVSATFKLVPRLSHPSTLVARFRDPATLQVAVDAILGSQLEPVAFDVSTGLPPAGEGEAAALLLRFASTPRAVEAQVRRARDLLGGADISLHDGDADRDRWRGQVTGPWQGSGAVVRLAWHSAALPEVLRRLDETGRLEGVSIGLTGRVGVGAGVVRLAGATDAQAQAIAALRSARPPFGAVTVLRADPGCKDRVDVWGAPSPARLALQAIKRAFDPADLLGAGRGPV